LKKYSSSQYEGRVKEERKEGRKEEEEEEEKEEAGVEVRELGGVRWLNPQGVLRIFFRASVRAVSRGIATCSIHSSYWLRRGLWAQYGLLRTWSASSAKTRLLKRISAFLLVSVLFSSLSKTRLLQLF
jgi:hypothetical protein